MRTLTASQSAHPTGDCQIAVEFPCGSWPLDTPGGRFFAEWDPDAPVTREGQLIFFFQFLHAAALGLPGLWQMLEGLPRSSWPTFVRGDCGFGDETIMAEFEARDLPYLFKLRHMAKVKTLVQQMMRTGALWQDCGAIRTQFNPRSARGEAFYAQMATSFSFLG